MLLKINILYGQTVIAVTSPLRISEVLYKSSDDYLRKDNRTVLLLKWKKDMVREYECYS